jgi:hypothetical protein
MAPLPLVGVRVLWLIGTGILDEDGVLILYELVGTGMLDDDGVRDLPLIGVLSWEELDGVRPLPLVTGVEVLRGVEDPKPTGAGL